MKLAKLSLAAITVVSLTASAFAADTLAGAFKEGKVSGQLQEYYMLYSVDGANNDFGANSVGGKLNYKTGTFNGFSAGFEFQSSHNLGIDVGDGPDGSMPAVNLLSEAYLGYSINQTMIKVGRQHIGTPLVSDSGSRFIRDYFTGLTVVNTSLKDVTLVGGAVTEWTNRNGSVAHVDDPVYTVYAAGNFSGVKLRGQYVYNNSMVSGANDKTQDYYLDANFAMNNFYAGAQLIGFKSDAFDSNLYGVKAGAKFNGLGLMVAYTSTNNDGPVRGGWGNGSDPSYNSIQKLSGNGAGVDSYQGKVSYDFSKVGVAGWTAFTRYASYSDYSGAGLDANEWDVDSTYHFAGSLKGLSAQVRYANVSYDATTKNDYQNFRFIAKYNF